MVHLGAVNQCVQHLVPLPVVSDCLQKLFSCIFLFVKYQLLDCNQRVCAGCNTQRLRSYAVVFSSACRNIHSAVKAVLKECGYIRQRFSLSVGSVDYVKRCAHLLYPVFKLLLHALKKLAHIFVFRQISGIRSKPLA